MVGAETARAVRQNSTRAPRQRSGYAPQRGRPGACSPWSNDVSFNLSGEVRGGARRWGPRAGRKLSSASPAVARAATQAIPARTATEIEGSHPADAIAAGLVLVPGDRLLRSCRPPIQKVSLAGLRRIGIGVRIEVARSRMRGERD